MKVTQNVNTGVDGGETKRGLASKSGHQGDRKEIRGKRPALKEDPVMVVANAVEREFLEIDERTEVDPKWSDTGVERILRLLEELRLNGTRSEF